jgi:hypothetical protein
MAYDKPCALLPNLVIGNPVWDAEKGWEEGT